MVTAREESSIRGFTLVELIVVLAIASTALLVGAFAAATAYDSARYRSFVRDVMHDLRNARIEALQTGVAVSYHVDLEHMKLGLAGRERDAPPGVTLDAIVAHTALESAARGAIRFFPDGGATGGAIIVRRQSGDGVRLRVDWLLGRVSIEAVGQP